MYLVPGRVQFNPRRCETNLSVFGQNVSVSQKVSLMFLLTFFFVADLYCCDTPLCRGGSYDDPRAKASRRVSLRLGYILA